MTKLGSTSQIDGQWIDYYALLGVPPEADEDSIRRRIGKAYADASANSEHRDLARRQYYQALVERVLPQCRRVMLDAQWRERYDEQHRLHRANDGAAQNYVEFIASMRKAGKSTGAGLDEALLPQRALEEMDAARRVVATALSGAELDLLPSQTVSQRTTATAPVAASAPELDLSAIPQMNVGETTDAEPEEENFAPRGKKRRHLSDSSAANAPSTSSAGQMAAPAIFAQIEPAPSAPISDKTLDSPASQAPPKDDVVTHRQPGEAARATVITAQEAADIRRRRASNPNSAPFVGPSSRAENSKKKSRSRVVVEAEDAAQRRKLSPTSLNLMVAITGVLLTITIQHFADTPAVATTAGRTPIVLSVAPEMESAIERAGAAWQKTPAGAPYEIMVQSADSSVTMQRALDKSGDQIDGWIPSSAGYAQRYNELAPAAQRPVLQIGDSLAQTPMVLVAQSSKAAALRRAFPDHKIGTWAALRAAVMSDASGHFGLSDPRQSLPGAVARYSMAREWGAGIGKSAPAAAKDANFWKWMAGFEENVPASAPAPDAMVKDMVLGTTGRYFWAVSYESDALHWIGQGKPLELFYLPRTTLADHPFCAVERVGAPIEVAGGRAAFVDYLKSDAAQKMLLQSGFRPTEISPASAVEKNPFTAKDARDRGVKLKGLPRDERFNIGALGTIQKQWSQYYG